MGGAIRSTACRRGMGSFAFLQALGTLDSCSPSIHSGPSALSSLPLCCWVSPQTMALSRWPLPRATLPTKGSPHPSPTHTCSRSSQGPGLFPCFCLTFFPLLLLYLSNFVASSKLAFKIYPRSEHCFHLHCSLPLWVIPRSAQSLTWPLKSTASFRLCTSNQNETVNI